MFDTDSHAIGVDNHTSRTMNNDINQFISALVPEPDLTVKGAGGNLQVMGSGTLGWRIQDNTGKIHTIIEKDAIYVPKRHTCLLSPQHWAQGLNDNSPKLDGTWCETYANRCILEWNQRKCKRTIRFNKYSTNTPIIYLAPGYNVCKKKIDILDVVAKSAQLCQRVSYPSKTSDEPTIKEENITNFLPSNVIHEDIQEENELDSISSAGELLRWHHRLGHVSFTRMRILMMLGILPKKLLTVKTPMCASCKEKKMTKKPVRVKGSKKRNKLKEVFSPGECVSVDQLESRTPGFIGVLIHLRHYISRPL